MFILDDDFKFLCEGDIECCYNIVEENFLVNLNFFVLDFMFNFNSFVYIVVKVVNNYYLD